MRLRHQKFFIFTTTLRGRLSLETEIALGSVNELQCVRAGKWASWSTPNILTTTPLLILQWHPPPVTCTAVHILHCLSYNTRKKKRKWTAYKQTPLKGLFMPYCSSRQMLQSIDANPVLFNSLKPMAIYNFWKWTAANKGTKKREQRILIALF